MRVILFLFLSCLVPLSAAAHVFDARVFNAFQFPDDRIPLLDGDLSDWEIVPPEYFVDYTYHKVAILDPSPAHDLTDLHIKRIAVGWNDAANRLYFMAEVYDDVHRFYKEDPDSLDTYFSRLKGAYVHGCDIWEIVIDADHAGDQVVGFDRENPQVEMRHRSAYTQNYHLYIPPINGYYWHWLWGKATWTAAPEYSALGWHYEGKHLSAGTVAYECYLTPFDDLHPDGPDSSALHDLRENAIIGLSWAFLDADSSDTKFDAFWSFSKQVEVYNGAENLADFRLMPVGRKADLPTIPEAEAR